MGWYIFLLVIMAFPLMLSYFGNIRKINVSKLVIPMATIPLLFFMSFRAINVGADTKQYVFVFNQISNISLFDLFKTNTYAVGGRYRLSFEYGYRLFNKLVSYFSTDGQAITVANSILIIFLLSLLIKKRSMHPALSIWLYITLGVFQTEMNMSRNAIAILICYLSLQFIKEKKLVKYILCVLIATLFHTSSILFIPLYWIVDKVKLTPKLMRKILIIAIVLGFGFSIVRQFLITSLPFGYGRYLIGNNTKLESLAVGVMHLLLVLLTWIMMDRAKKSEAIQAETIGIWMFTANIFFFCIGYDVHYAVRMAALFGPYLIILIPNLLMKGIETENKRFNAIVIIIILTGITYILRLRINNIGATVPYEFFWT